MTFTTDMIGYPYKINKEHRIEAKLVDITHIRKKTALAIEDLRAELDRPIDLSIPRDLSGFQPVKLIVS
jgi:hypothetical protein